MKASTRFFCVAASCCAFVFGTPAAAKPNVLLLVVDDLGWGETGAQGFAKDIPTPHLDALARGGVRCTHGYVTAPVCAPSRAALFTGRYQTRFGYELNVIGKQNLDPRIGVALTEKTLADRMRAAGYATALVGKWHLGGTPQFHPQRRGFDEFFGFLHEGHFFLPQPYEGARSFLRRKALAPGERTREGNITWSNHAPGDEPPYDENNPLMRGAEVVSEPAYLTRAFTREASAFIARNKARPWILAVTYSAVHSPMQAMEDDLARVAGIADEHRRIFAAMLTSLDDSVGALTGALREHGLEKDTLVVFVGDNGAPTAELTSSNGPLRGGKGQLYEGGVRVPFFARWPGRIPAGGVFTAPVSTLDILPTALAAAGEKPPADLDGVDLLPHWRGETNVPPHATLYWRYGAQFALREGRWKLVHAGKQTELFDVDADPGETTDLAAREPERAAELLARWRAIDAPMVAPIR
ncbi:MAG: sulfatase-like hydrolase/transferase [Chthoniobacteraceae bacterium]